MSDRSLTLGEVVARSLPGEGMEGWRRGAKECSVGKGLNRMQAGPGGRGSKGEEGTAAISPPHAGLGGLFGKRTGPL